MRAMQSLSRDRAARQSDIGLSEKDYQIESGKARAREAAQEAGGRERRMVHGRRKGLACEVHEVIIKRD